MNVVSAMSKRTFALSPLLLALLLMAILAPSPARADVYVLESTTAAISPGKHLSSGEIITIPDGSYIRAVLPSGKTQTIRGPFSGPVANLDKGQAHNEGVLAWIRGLLETGGAREATPGATRSISLQPAVLRLPFSWSAIPVTTDATLCIKKGSAVELVRPASWRAQKVTILDPASGARGEAEWEAGSATVPWPPGLALNADGIYYVLVPDRPQRQITVRLLDAPPPDEEMLVRLHALGCKPQFDSWVRDRVANKGKP